MDIRKSLRDDKEYRYDRDSLSRRGCGLVMWIAI